MSRRILAILLILVVGAFTGCTQGADFLFSNDPPKEEWQSDSTVHVPIERLRSLNPLISKDEDMLHISNLVFDGLFKLDEYMRPQKNLVEDYRYNDKSLEIELKRNVLWHDGETFSAKDVKFTIEAIIYLAKIKETIYEDYVSAIKNVVLNNDNPYILTINFNNNTNVGMENLIFPILPAHQFNKVSDIRNDSNYEMIGTGKYKLSEYHYLSNLTLVPFENYHDGKVNNNMCFEIVPDNSFATNMTKAGEITLFFEKNLERESLLAKQNLQAINFVSNEIEVIGFNFTNQHLANKQVRQAIACAVNLDDILNTAYYKNGIITDSVYYPNLYTIENMGDQYPYDLEKASMLFKEAGYEDSDDNGYIENSNNKELSFEILVSSDNEMRVTAAKMIKENLDKLGVITKIVFCKTEEYINRVNNGQYDMYIGGYKIDQRFNLKPLLFSGENNLNYVNPIVSEYLKQIEKSDDLQERTQHYKRMKNILIDELPYYCMLYKTYGCFITQFFDGEVLPQFHNLYYNCETWLAKYPEGFIVQLNTFFYE